MNEEQRRRYLEEYQQAKKRGVPFFPEILFKDAVVSLAVFLALVALAFFVGAPLEARADPSDTNYTPRPEWYFLFLFQLLKYFPGQLEVIGVIVLPTLAILILIALPFLDRSARRHYLTRPVITTVTGLSLVGVVWLTVQAHREAPPPTEAVAGDETAALYAANCAACHGPSLSVPEGVNLHALIAQGKHEGMPAWSGDLSSDQIDALAGFILSPTGSRLFTEQCGSCHEAPELVAGDPLQLKAALEQADEFPAHEALDVPRWSESLKPEERTALLNFLAAPDGQRLFATNCSPCHGRAVAFAGEEADLRELIVRGGLHLEMPPWRARLSEDEIDRLAAYVVDPDPSSATGQLFGQYCSTCHGQRIPKAESIEEAVRIIAGGGSHQTMPVWGKILTPEQLEALVSYTMASSTGEPLQVGQELFAKNCSGCHGEFGEGGSNPARPGDVIAPISSAEYLKTRDDSTLRAIIAQGQPNFGMSPFSMAAGGPLDDEEIDSIVAFMRAWEATPPVELPPEVAAGSLSLSGEEIFAEVCAQCHGSQGEGGIGPSLRDADFQRQNSDDEIFKTINLGHEATAMIAWGEILSSEQIEALVSYIRKLGETTTAVPSGDITFEADVLPIFQAQCVACHGTMGGWDGSTYEAAMSTGDHAPVVLPGDPQGSLLAQKLLGTQEQGMIMPPAGKLVEAEISILLKWIEAGAPK
jgi:mono/diheme cytochrome c family protein